MMDHILQNLRTETQSLHHEVEKKLNLLDSTLSVARYEQILRSFLGFYLSLESKWKSEMPGLAWEHDFSAKISALRKDLDVLSENQPIDDQPRGLFPPLGPGWWGVLYVTEGSNLGGQVICRHLQKTDLIPKEAMNFYGGDPAGTGPRWQKFLAALRDPSLPASSNQICESAKWAFNDLTMRFDTPSTT